MAIYWGAFCDDSGIFSLDDRKGFLQWVKKFAGHELIMIVKRKPRYQGTQSMRYLHGVVIPDIAKACGYVDPDDWEDVWQGLAWKFLRLSDGPFGQPRRRSTRKEEMSQQEMTALIDQIITYAETSIPGCRVRRPEEADLDDVIDPEWT